MSILIKKPYTIFYKTHYSSIAGFLTNIIVEECRGLLASRPYNPSVNPNQVHLLIRICSGQSTLKVEHTNIIDPRTGKIRPARIQIIDESLVVEEMYNYDIPKEKLKILAKKIYMLKKERGL